MANNLLDKSPDELYPRKHMLAIDLQGRAWVLKIKEVKQVRVFIPRLNAEEDKIAVCFAGAKRYLLVNKTQGLALFELTGAKKAPGWEGHTVMLRPARTRRGGATIEIVAAPHTEMK